MPMPNGILLVDKPSGWTSFDVLAKLRGALGTRRLGHAGTLDPMATGVLAVFIGKATAAADRQLNHDKTYEATIRLGLRTDTGDITGTANHNEHETHSPFCKLPARAGQSSSAASALASAMREAVSAWLI